MSKISQYFNTFEITRGFFIALLGSAFIYLEHGGLSYPLIYTLLGLASLYLLLKADKAVWFWTGFFTGAFWFWWIVLSFKHYGFFWAAPFGLFLIALAYAALFWALAYLVEKLVNILKKRLPTRLTDYAPLLPLILKSAVLLGFSYIHPLGFDWYKPELMFVQSYVGIEKWQFAVVLGSFVLIHWKQNPLFLLLILLTSQPQNANIGKQDTDVYIVTTNITVEEKWKERLQSSHFKRFFNEIDHAIEQNKTLVILPESVFPVFLNRSNELLGKLSNRAQKIDIVTGGLYADGTVPRNSTFIFTKKQIQVANKVLLVPFGEKNPLPDFLGKWVNEIFYDGAVDYKASAEVTDYTVAGKTYRNAICFEATSEKLYEGSPKNMIVLSNNGWFVPSVEPTLQQLLLLYYNKKYGTTIYHSVNMSSSYIIQGGVVRKVSHVE